MAHEQSARDFISAIQEIAAEPQKLDNLELYLSYHFSEWLKKYANTPEGIAAEMKEFSQV